MSRKRIILCLDKVGWDKPGWDKSGDCDPVAKFVARYFSNEQRLVRIHLSAEKLSTKELASARNLTANPYFPDESQQSKRCATNEYPESDTIFKKISQEARFSDLLVISEGFYRWLGSRKGTEKSTGRISCPKLIVPERKEAVDQIIVVDDGQPETHSQIKYLSGMFSELCMSIPTVLLTIPNQRNSWSLKEEKLWIDYLKTHFAELAVHRLEEQTASTLKFTVDFSKNALLIGAFANSSALQNTLHPRNHFRLLR